MFYDVFFNFEGFGLAGYILGLGPLGYGSSLLDLLLIKPRRVEDNPPLIELCFGICILCICRGVVSVDCYSLARYESVVDQ